MPHRVTFVEPLEDRRLMSSTPVYGQWNVGMSKGQYMQDAQAAEYQRQVAHSIAVGKAAGIAPSVLGTWKGKVKAGAFFVSKTFNMTLDVTHVGPKRAKGTVTVDGHKIETALRKAYGGPAGAAPSIVRLRSAERGRRHRTGRPATRPYTAWCSA